MKKIPNTILNKRLPAFSGLFVLLIALAITITMSKNTLFFITKATIGSVPKEVQISNVTANSFSVTYRTDEKAIGTISYGLQNPKENIELDERDKVIAKPVEHALHKITVTNLQPATKYYFTITSGTQTVSENGTPYEVTTAPVIANPFQLGKSIRGSVANDDGTLPTEGIVSISGENMQPLNVLLAPDGNYTIPLVTARTKDLQLPFQITSQTIFTVKILTPDAQSEAKIAAGQIDEIPKMILTKTYDFSQSPDDRASTASTTQASASAAFPTETLTQVDSPQITSPSNDQSLKDTQPLFKGRALPNTDIELTILSDQEMTVKLQSDTNGVWEFRPPVQLSPGTNSITIASIDASGIVQKITRSFTVYAEGSKFVEPSVSPIASPTKTNTSTPTPTKTSIPPTNTPAPTIQTSPTASPTAILNPTPIPTILPTTMPTVSQTPMKPTGSSWILDGVVGMATALGIGTLLFIVTAL